MNDLPLLQCKHLCKNFYDGAHVIHVLNSIDFTINRGERIAIIGPSGSGKSTFLHLLSGLDKPTSGEVLLESHNWQLLSEKQRCQLRNQELGFIYQFHHLLPEFTALENVAMPLLLAGMPLHNAITYAETILSDVGLAERMQHKPAQLSGGERQRVAIARALVRKPSCVIADEPTGNLDQATARKSFDLMLQLNMSSNTALVVVTHDQNLAACMDKVYSLKDGYLEAI